MQVAKEAGPMTDFDDGLFGAVADTVTVYADKLVFSLKDGSERMETR